MYTSKLHIYNIWSFIILRNIQTCSCTACRNKHHSDIYLRWYEYEVTFSVRFSVVWILGHALSKSDPLKHSTWKYELLINPGWFKHMVPPQWNHVLGLAHSVLWRSLEPIAINLQYSLPAIPVSPPSDCILFSWYKKDQ